MQRRREARALHHVVRAAGPPPRQRLKRRMLADDPEIVEAEVLHGPRRRADVARLARLDQNDAQHGPYANTAGLPIAVGWSCSVSCWRPSFTPRIKEAPFS